MGDGGGGGWSLAGVAVLRFEGDAAHVRYRVQCDSGWRTREVQVTQTRGGEERRLHLLVDREGRWRVDGRERPELRGCADVDLGITPATNTLPIRRLNLPVGASESVTAAWVRFPELSVEPLPQRYTRLGERRYRYESGNGSYETEIEVDELGLVTKYGEVWEQATGTSVGA